MKNNPVDADRGLALILVISFIAALVVSGILLNRQVRGMLVSSATASHTLRLTEMGRSGIEAAVLRLEFGSNEDVLGWLLFETEMAAFNADIQQVLSFPRGSIEVRIIDDRARIPVNALVKSPQRQQFNPEQQQLWERFLRNYKEQIGDEVEFSEIEIIDALKDWLDSGDDDAITGLSGAERDYYEGLSPPYAPANAPLQHTGELLLVKGMPPELFHGSGDVPGLSRYVTAHGATGSRAQELRFDGKINLNTAEESVIAAILPIEYQSLAASIVTFRQERIAEEDAEALKQAAWYKSAPGCADLELPAALITTSSDRFRVVARVTGDQHPHEVTAIVQCRRSGAAPTQKCQILRYE
jgi:general secretion pathway protein K